MKTLFPSLEPYKTSFLKVSEIHEIYLEECGNPNGKPVLFLHGGPGAGTIPKHRQFFDPEFYRIILFDQRGAGKSKPHACLEENTTWDLVSDIEKIRQHLNIKKWLVFGGSWGSTLGLAYAETHPERVKGLILRGIFLCRPEEIQWFYQGNGCDWLFPDAWEKYVSVIPPEERSDMLTAYHKRLLSKNEEIRLEAARAWSQWEGSTLKLIPDADLIDAFGKDHLALSLARIECHYFRNNSFLEENQLIRDAHKIAQIPTVLVHGRYDVICPVKNAWQLHKALPKARLEIVADAGHAADEPGIIDALLRATEEFKFL